MDLPHLLHNYQEGRLLQYLSDQSALLEANQRIQTYYKRLVAIQPPTDFITNQLSLLVDMQEMITQRLTILHLLSAQPHAPYV